MGKWVLVTLLLIVALLTAFFIFIATGVIDGPALFWKYGPKIAWLQPHLETYSCGRDSEAWLAVQEEELQGREAAVQERHDALAALEKELEQRSAALDKRENELNQRQSAFQQEQAQRRSIQKLAELYTEMPPEEVAAIIQKLDEAVILEVLLLMDMQDAANVLTQLPTDLAVTLSKRLGEAGN